MLENEKKFLGGAPNSTIAALTDVRNGFAGKSVMDGRWRTMAELGFCNEFSDAFGITFLSLFVLSHAFGTFWYTISL